MLRDFTKVTYDALMTELNGIVEEIRVEAFAQGLVDSGEYVVSGAELERLANEMGLPVDLEDLSQRGWAYYLKDLEDEVVRQEERLAQVWEDVGAAAADYAYQFELLEAESDTYSQQTKALIELFDPNKKYFDENPADFAARCGTICATIDGAAENAAINLEIARMGGDGYYDWDYINQVMLDDNATDEQIAALMIVYMDMDNPADMEQFIKCGYRYQIDEYGQQQLVLTPTFLRMSDLSGELLLELTAMLDNPDLSSDDYDAAQLDDQMQKLGILLTVGANHATITVPDNWMDGGNPNEPVIGPPGSQGTPVRIYFSKEGGYSIACSRFYPYRNDFDAEQGQYAISGQANSYYHVTGLLSDANLILTAASDVKVSLESMRPNTGAGQTIGPAAFGFVLGEIVGKIFTVVGSVVYAGGEAFVDWVDDSQTSDQISNTQDFIDFTTRVFLLGGTLAYTIDNQGVYTVTYKGYNTQEAYFRIDGYLEMYPGMSREDLIKAVENGEEPTYGKFKEYIDDWGHRYFRDSLARYYTYLYKNGRAPRDSFEALSINELRELNQQMKSDVDYVDPLEGAI